ncbi:MAG TPA: DUF4276 family protein, partial [Anaerolineae bacterium]|nr:DUF4276 family protein [Anaerolineae bacterium]
VMESWFIADVKALKDFYRENFKEEKLLKETNVEKISKNKVEILLKTATRKTIKGKYHKIFHGPEILKLLDSECVREKAPHCDRLFATLENRINVIE